MKTTVGFAFLFLCCTFALAQQSAAPQWTGQNNVQMTAAYMLRVSYYEHGYMGARVQVTQQQGSDVFAVEPGPVYHFSSIAVTGLPEELRALVMQDAPKAGDVYSQAKVAEWLSNTKKRLAAERQNTRIASPRISYDHTNATATVVVAFQ